MRRRLDFLVVLLMVAAIGCAARAPHINDLEDNPGRYYDRTVAVEGTVTSAWRVPLLPVGLYRIDDGTGELTIVSRNGRVPTKGARVRVTGKVGDVAVLGGESLGLHVQEQRLSVLRP
ncbi:MAG: hypothetical protein AB7I50_03870 [Vicinamibacterales bacterium]